MPKTRNVQENEKLVQEITSRMNDLNNETIKMSESENDKANEIMDAAAEILGFNEQYQQGRGLHILTPEQMTTNFCSSIKSRK